MGLTCNIDENGARLRLGWGIMVLMAGVVLGGLALWWGSWWLWCLVGVCVLAGGLAVFEGRKKWCVLRAMGVKTPV